MKTRPVRFLVMCAAAGLVATGAMGCRSHERTVVVHEPATTYTPTGPVVVTTEPPPVRQEIVGIAPSGQHVWVPGYWSYENNRWVWLPGRWEARPQATATYVAGHWDQRGNGWVWTPGYWK